ncbi:MAG: fatty acid desaturase [Deltaproteobacteria bacterium]|nr:fatty acid desaturase [Deltaproteobacteria bacterium]
MNKDGLLKYNIDVQPVAMVLVTVGLSLLPFFVAMPVWFLVPYFVLVIFAKSFIPFAQHNHAHLAIFNSKALNHVFDVFLTQCTGYPTALWELHHTRGHHRNFLTPELDVARIIDLKTGQVMSRWRYALNGNMTIHRDSIQIGKEEGRQGRKPLLAKLYGEIAVQTAITLALLAWHPWLALTFFVIPNTFNSFMIWWESYPHHLGVPTTSLYDASVTIESRSYNLQTLNLGHHTAHHEKPTLHWSLLPARTEAIRSRIPEMCVHEEYSRSSKVQLAETRRKSEQRLPREKAAPYTL